jgi:hypothetical protein
MSIIKYLVYIFISYTIMGCSAQKSLTTESPYSQASVVVHLKNGEKVQGIVLKREGNNLVYIDAKSHKKETIEYEYIKKLTRADVVYDFEAHAIPNYVIDEEKKSSKKLLYGSGGFILGAAVGTGVAIGLISGSSGDVSSAVTISSIAVGAIGGAWFFGARGSESDYQDAIFEVRKQRYKVSKSDRDREIAEEKRKLDAQQKKKEEMLKKIKKKKKN